MKAKQKVSVIVLVWHDSNEFQYHYFGDVEDIEGKIKVDGTKGTSVKIEFTAVAGEGVDDVSFMDDPKQSIRIGPKDVMTCPPVSPNEEFDSEKHGKFKNVITVRDKGTDNGDFQYALYFRVQRTGGKPEDVSHDPMIINNFH